MKNTGRCRSKHPGRTDAIAEPRAGATGAAVCEKEREARVVDGVTASRTTVDGGVAIVSATGVGGEEGGAGTITGTAQREPRLRLSAWPMKGCSDTG